jgi:hypothetical protein
LQVPWFTSEELPIKEPANLANYSIGEEISASPPIAIAWSPPGIAEHRRCALATLTGSLVLSIWSAGAKQDEGKNWSRRLIVNNALAEYFSTNTADELDNDMRRPDETMRLRTRIRAFAWASALPISRTFSSLGSRLSYGQQLMVVSNDGNQLAFLVIESPTSTQGEDSGWSAKVLAHISLTPDPRSPSSMILSSSRGIFLMFHGAHGCCKMIRAVPSSHTLQTRTCGRDSSHTPRRRSLISAKSKCILVSKRSGTVA